MFNKNKKYVIFGIVLIGIILVLNFKNISVFAQSVASIIVDNNLTVKVVANNAGTPVEFLCTLEDSNTINPTVPPISPTTPPISPTTPPISPTTPQTSPTAPVGGGAIYNVFNSASISDGEKAFTASGPGTDVDTIAFWENQTNPRMFVSAKNNDLVEEWLLNGTDPQLKGELKPSCFGGGGSTRVNGVVVDQETDILYVSVSSPVNKVCIFSIDENATTYVSEINTGHELKSEPNVGLLKLANGQKYLYVTADNPAYVYDLSNPTSPTETSFSPVDPGVGIETVIGDNYYERVLFPDEKGKSGLYSFDYQGSPKNVGSSNHFGQGVTDGDGEGVLIYTCPKNGVGDNGEGYIVLSDQTNPTDFEFFSRKNGDHLGTLNIDGVDNTDGIASTQMNVLGNLNGVFAAINNDSNTVGVSWDVIFSKTGLGCTN